MSGQKTCSFAFCYYNIAENALKDGVSVQSHKCDHCDEAFYHSEFCKKLDKEHQKKCRGTGRPQKGPLQRIDVEEKENRRSNARLETSREPRRSREEQPAGKPQPKSAALRLHNYEVSLQRVLGEGSYGRVVSGRELLTGVEVAVKMVSKAFLKSNAQAVLLKREIHIQRKLRHQNILALRDVFEDEQHIYLVLEYCAGGSLFDYVQAKKGLSEKESFVFFLQACLAVETLHRSRIVHRDIKPENLLLDKAKNLKLCDFGCSFEFLKHTPAVRKTYCGTVDYMAPEFFQKVPHGMAADVWALGVLLFEMVHARPPFDADDEADKIEAILDSDNQTFDFKAAISGDFKDLVQKLLTGEPRQRLTFDEIFAHPWMLLQAQKLGVDIQKIRYRDSLFGDYDPKEVQEFFARCELRPTEVVMYADSEYLDMINQPEEGEEEESEEGYKYEDTSRNSNKLDNVNILGLLEDDATRQVLKVEEKEVVTKKALKRDSAAVAANNLKKTAVLKTQKPSRDPSVVEMVSKEESAKKKKTSTMASQSEYRPLPKHPEEKPPSLTVEVLKPFVLERPSENNRVKSELPKARASAERSEPGPLLPVRTSNPQLSGPATRPRSSQQQEADIRNRSVSPVVVASNTSIG